MLAGQALACDIGPPLEAIELCLQAANSREVCVEPFVPFGPELSPRIPVSPEVFKIGPRVLKLDPDSITFAGVRDEANGAADLCQHQLVDVALDVLGSHLRRLRARSAGVAPPAAIQALTARAPSDAHGVSASGAADEPREQRKRSSIPALPSDPRGHLRRPPKFLGHERAVSVGVDDRAASVDVLLDVARSLTSIDPLGAKALHRLGRPDRDVVSRRNPLQPCCDRAPRLPRGAALEHLACERGLIVRDEAAVRSLVVAEYPFGEMWMPRSIACRCATAQDSFSVERVNSANTNSCWTNARPAGVA